MARRSRAKKSAKKKKPAAQDERRRIAVELANVFADPVLFVQRVLKQKTWSTQEAILDAIARYPLIAVKGCHASSKTFSAASAVLWFLARYGPDAVVITTGPTARQIRLGIWGEIHAALEHSRIEFPEPNQMEMRLGPKWYAIGMATSKGQRGVRFSGLRAGHTLVIVEEAPGVDEAIYEAIEGIRAGGDVTVLLLGNPTVPGGPFYDAFTRERARWHCITIDGMDTPNLRGLSLDDLRAMPRDAGGPLDDNEIPYLIGRRYIREMAEKWGEENPRFISRVRGQFPKESEWSLIPLAWIEKAKWREVEEKRSGHRLTVGIDVGAGGEGETVVTVLDMGHYVKATKDGRPIANPAVSTAADARGEVAAALANFKGELGVVRYDAIGVGAYLGPHLADLGYSVVGVNVAKPSSDTEKFPRLRDELGWQLREAFEAGRIAGLDDETTIAQLAALRYEHTKDGRIRIEEKREYIKRTGHSPDRADSLMLAATSGLGGVDKIPEIGAVLKSRWSMHPT